MVLEKHVVVCVLGDLGRSPRMQYHAQSLSNMGVERVTLLGYDGERCMRTTESNGKIVQHRLTVPEFGNRVRRLPLLHAVLKGFWILFSILQVLISLPPYDAIIVQNPPALPALAACLLADALQLFYKPPARIVIDWHNLGFSMFQEKAGAGAVVVRVSRLLEKVFSRVAHRHLCVSRAMSKWLAENFHIEAKVLYDRPNASFKREPPSIVERHNLLHRLGFTPSELFGLPPSGGENGHGGIGGGCGTVGEGQHCVTTIHTQQYLSMSTDYGMVGKQPKLLIGGNGRIPLIISSTSWTPDEDFTILLTALLDLNKKLVRVEGRHGDNGMRVLVVVTGKGPTKQAFLDRVAALSSNKEGSAQPLSHICIKTVWLEPEDYPLLMRCADVGVCLHTSSSGLDLPMKVLDMFGSSLPVVAVNFPTLPELVQDGENGFIFDTDQPEMLSESLFALLSHGKGAHFPSQAYLAMKERAGQLSDWDANWTEHAEPLIRTVLQDEGGASLAVMAFRLAFQTLSLALLYGLLCGVLYLDKICRH